MAILQMAILKNAIFSNYESKQDNASHTIRVRTT
uniref:Uncharacterized protein n=1 Tax=Arundo donax TaxID=35708 RepID=A0A0A9G0R6_ARUDO